MQQLATLIEQAFLLLVQLACLTIRSTPAGGELTTQAGFDLLAQFGDQLDRLVFLFDQFLHTVN
ncbi:hypothetical protein [Nocardia nova]|uniref:hypothetical protein n=1 Tax=Nocardia nova TaxID=37330 RepID=UPI002739BFC7|nr:hypothetical protein [Nocardia nova]